MKILYVTTIGSTMDFFRSLLRELTAAGHTVEIATNETERPVSAYFRSLGCTVHQIDCSRSPLSGGNRKAVRQLRALVQQEHYDIVHCHTPVAALCTRLACRGVRKTGTRVFYTAHGFHFYKGAPKKNWLLFYPIEKFCARMTDVLVTINHEDFERAKRKLHAGQVVYVPGVGIDTARFRDAAADRAEMRRSLGIPEAATVLLSVGELNQNKNHETAIRAIAELQDPSVYYLIAGVGPLKDSLTALAAGLGLADRVQLLGYRNDVDLLYKTADILVFPSFREGLPVSVMEAMASGLPIVAASNRGTRELIRDGENGILCPPGDAAAFRNALASLCAAPQKRAAFAAAGQERAQRYDQTAVNREMFRLYGIPQEGGEA